MEQRRGTTLLGERVPSFRFVSEGIGEASAKRRFDTVFGSQAMRSVLDDGFRPAKKFVGRFG